MSRKALREAFAALAAMTPFGVIMEAWDVHLEKMLLAVYWERFPKRKAKPSITKIEIELPEDYDRIFKRLKKAADRLYAGETVRVERIQTRIEELAGNLKPRRGKTFFEVDEVYACDFRSQEWGASTYAKAQAEQHADAIRAKGYEVIVETEGKESHTLRYIVKVKLATTLDVELIKRMPVMSLRDWLKDCWRRGVNPRVYRPMLPAGLEGKLGIDYFGNEIAKTG